MSTNPYLPERYRKHMALLKTEPVFAPPPRGSNRQDGSTHRQRLNVLSNDQNELPMSSYVHQSMLKSRTPSAHFGADIYSQQEDEQEEG